MMKVLIMDENLSNLTSAFGDPISASSVRTKTTSTMFSQRSFDSTNQAPPPKKKRSLLSNPADPDAEVIALSPKTLLATNRFIYQNLQLCIRGHNLPWKLKQRVNKEALRDLTGIKKHFCKKHGEKKWKCENARAIMLNPLLSSHQQFSSLASPMINLQALSVKREQESHHLLNPRLDNNAPPWLAYKPVGEVGSSPPLINLSSSLYPVNLDQSFVQYENPSHDLTLQPFQPLPASSPHTFAAALLQKAPQMGVTMSKPSPSPTSIFAAAMLGPRQAHMFETISGFSSTLIATSIVGFGLGLSLSEDMGSGFGHGLASLGNKVVATSGGPSSFFHDIMSSLSSASGFVGSSFNEDFNGMLNPKRGNNNFLETLSYSKSIESQFSSRSDSEDSATTATTFGGGSGHGGGNDGLTQDFLSLKVFSHKDFLNLAGLGAI
ncbi:hypothetical protein P3X46_019769 [Hevea brasiliensis]|uniref:BIRD-IDD transcription factor second C2H2 zinc finger domain-containing protein n=1 Tax=Hevea brasiliensis TaxID=3981 RepID=A0ABQ9LNJ9_HEVBR|nr:hypothetical protein P3X46_019769 [Hevea brasiliensis]